MSVSSLMVMRMYQKVGIVLFLSCLLFGLSSMTRSMITWDEPENYFVGRVYLNVLLDRSLGPLQTDRTLRLPPALPFRIDTHWERYPPFAITLASFSSWILAETLHVTDVVSAHHVVVVLFAAIAVAATYAIGFELSGSVFLASIAGVVLYLSPIFFGHSHINIKDIPQTAMFVLSIYFGMVATRKATPRAYALAGSVWGIALATKFNALFVPVVLGVWFVSKYKVNKIFAQMPHLFIYILFGLVTLFVFWPWLLLDPVGHIGSVVQYIGEVGRGLPVLFFGHRYDAGVSVPWWYAPTMVAVQSPPLVLFLASIGILGIVWSIARNRIRTERYMLPLIWVGIIFSRYLLPQVIIYNGARHIMEVFPALALLVMAGVSSVLTLIEGRVGQKIGTFGISFMIGLALIVPIITLHPYEAMYFNQIAGGIPSASKNFDFDYWGFSVGELVGQVNQHAKNRSSTVYIEWLNFPSQYFPDNTLPFVQTEKDNADFVIIPNSLNFFDGAIQYWKSHGKVLYAVTRSGVPIGYLFATKQ